MAEKNAQPEPPKGFRVSDLHGSGDEPGTQSNASGFEPLQTRELAPAAGQEAADAALQERLVRLLDENAILQKQIAERAGEHDRTWAVNPDLLAVANLEGYFEKSNPAWLTTLGWTEEEVRTTKFLDFVHPDDLERTLGAWREVRDGSPVFRFENRYRCKDGEFRLLSWVAVRDGEKVYSSARDVTAEKAQAEALAAQTVEVQRLWDLSPDLMVVIDFGGVVHRVNPAWTTILGYQPNDLLGRHINNFLLPEDVAPTQKALEDAAGAPLPTFENRYLHKDGSYRWISWVSGPGENTIYATGRHITAEKEIKEALHRAEEQLRQSHKMEAVGQLTGGIAHDFNNLLAGISGALELLEQRLGQGRLGGVERYISIAQGSARKAAALTQRLLAFARRQTLAPKAVDLNRLIGGMEDLIRRSVGPDVEVEVVGAGGLWPTLVDPSQLENALLNLCINARDAMAPEGGRLTIETANKWLDQRGALERDLAPGQYVSLCVTDSGTGMSPETIAHAFEPFFTTKPLGQGTGLGLSMVHGFVRQSGGQVRIYSEPGDGTTICLYLPRYLGEQPVIEFEEQFVANSGDGETVLVVDDEDNVRMLIVEVLEESGYTAIDAADGPRALKILQSDARIDLLITDVGLPNGMNGRQVADAARAVRPDLKVLFITGYAENAVIGNGLLDAGMEIMTKPFEMAALSGKVLDMIQR